MSIPGTLEFAGLILDGREDAYEYGWHLGDLKGWYDGPPSKASADPRPQDHGSFRVGRNLRGARVVSVEGSFAGQTMQEAEEARQQLAGLQADGVESPFTVGEMWLGSRTIGAVLVNGPTMPSRLFSPFFAFSFDVVAADPKKYGEEVSESTGVPVAGTGLAYPIVYPLNFGTASIEGRITLHNPGSTDTYPIVEVTGGLTGGFSAIEVGSGREIRFERFVPEESTVFLNYRTGRAYIDVPENDVSGFLTVSDWWPVRAGDTSTIQFTPIGATTGTPTLTGRAAPAYW